MVAQDLVELHHFLHSYFSSFSFFDFVSFVFLCTNSLKANSKGKKKERKKMLV